MLKNKNIAKVMATATVLTAAAPMTQVFAAEQRAVVDSNQTEEIKALKADVLEKFNTKYTKNQALLNGATPGGSVYTITIENVNNNQPFSNYAEFEKAFDEEYNKLENGQNIVVKYNSEEKKVNVLEDGEVVNFVESTYDNITKDGCEDLQSTTTGHVVFGELADKTPYAKIRISDDTETGEARYITVKNGDTKLDLAAPKFKVVDGYYVDANGNSIKKFDEETVKDDITFVKGKGGVVEGYYPAIDLDAQEDAKSDTGAFAIVKNVESAEKEEVTTNDLYEVEAGRLTQKGNELRKALLNPELVKPESERLLSVEITGTDKAGEKVDKDDLSAEKANLSNIKIVFSQRENIISEYKPVYEFVITSVKGNDFTAVIDSIIGTTDTTVDVAAGLDRYETAVEISKQGWDNNELAGGAVVLVSGANDKIVDGLTATPLAASLNETKGAPVLLTNKDSIPTKVIDEIERLGATEVYIVGGTSAVSQEVETLLSKTYGMDVTRLKGNDRYETSLAVANELKEVTGVNKFKHAFVVGGNGEADALSVSAIAGIRELPIILTPDAELTKDVEYFIDKNVELTNNTNVFVVGGVNSVSSNVQNELVDSGFKVERLSGDDRQETNAKVLDRFKTSLSMGLRTIDDVVVAKSDNNGLIDALAAGALAAKNEAHIVLATNELTESQTEALDAIYTTTVNTKVQAGYGIAEKVAKFIKGL